MKLIKDKLKRGGTYHAKSIPGRLALYLTDDINPFLHRYGSLGTYIAIVNLYETNKE